MIRNLYKKRVVMAFDSWAATYESDVRDKINRRGYSYASLGLAIVNRIHAKAGDTVLEVGTGPGNLGIEVNGACGFQLVGIDISGRMLEKANEKTVYTSLIRANAQSLPFSDGSFDCAYSAFVFHSLIDQYCGFRELYRILRPGAFAAIIDLYPAGTSVWKTAVAGLFHAIRYEFGAPAIYVPLEYTANAARKAGFNVCSVEPIGQKRDYTHCIVTVNKL